MRVEESDDVGRNIERALAFLYMSEIDDAIKELEFVNTSLSLSQGKVIPLLKSLNA